MSLVNEGERPIHYPSNPNAFAFDAEVASIFDNMARRSIPNYEELHRLHVAMFADRFLPGAVVCDVGASTGMFFRQIEKQIGRSLTEARIKGVAIDASEAMANRLRNCTNNVTVHACDVSEMPDLPEPADVIACIYVLQFLRGVQRERAIAWIARNLKPTGVIFLGQKEPSHWKYLSRATEAYHAFRRANGYTQDEIDAKTKALSGSMWVVSEQELRLELDQYGLDYVETTRWVQFTSGIASRRS